MAGFKLGLVLCALAFSAAALAGYPNPITDDEFVSVVTSSIDPVFYKIASEVGTDKVRAARRPIGRDSWVGPASAAGCPETGTPPRAGLGPPV